MRTDEHAEYRSQLTTRFISNRDLENVSAIIRSQPTMFGTSILDQHDKFVNSYSETGTGIKIGIEHNGTLFGLMKIYLWEKMPIWHVGSNFTMIDTGLNYAKNRIASLVMYEKCMSIAESAKYYDGYIALPDTGAAFTRRKEMHLQMSPYIDTRYIVNDVDFIPKFSKSKWEIFNVLIGQFAGNNARPIVIRHSHLRGEFRL